MVATILKNKILEGMKRIADDHPGIDFSVSTPAVNVAWDHLNAECVNYDKGTNMLADVHRAFKRWEENLKAAQPAPQSLTLGF